MTHSRNNKRGFTAVELVLVIVVLAIVVGMTMWQVDKRRQAQLRAESVANLMDLYATFTGRRNVSDPAKAKFGSGQEWAVMWGPPSSSPGQLAPKRTDELKKNIRRIDTFTAFISPAHPNAERLKRKAQSNPTSAITDDSYWYLGYELPTEEAGLLFVEAYKKGVMETGEAPKAEVLKVGLHNSANGVETAELSRLRHYEVLSGSNAVAFVTERGNFAAIQDGGLSAPVFIERPGLQRGGGHVLFADGSIKFMKYPGEFPMTEKFIKALESLDKLKESHADKPEN